MYMYIVEYCNAANVANYIIHMSTGMCTYIGGIHKQATDNSQIDVTLLLLFQTHQATVHTDQSALAASSPETHRWTRTYQCAANGRETLTRC